VTAQAAAPRVVGGVVELPLALVDPGPNRRGTLRDVDALATSIQRVGQCEPIAVTATGTGRYAVFDGHRRRAALNKLGRATVLAVVRRVSGEDRDLLQMAMHAQRLEFDPIAEATAIAHEMFDRPGAKRTREEIAEALGKSPSWVADRLQLLNLSPADQVAVAERRLSVTSALQLLRGRAAGDRGRARQVRSAGPAAAVVKAAGPVSPAVKLRRVAALVEACVGCSCCAAVAEVVRDDSA
jgi:ParB/RepB/Spo0J family partition protein